VAITSQDAASYLEALGTWRDQRRAELDLLDQAALNASGGVESATGITGDVMLSMALWKAVADRYDLLIATWDSGRVGPSERERLATLIWGRLDATLDPQLAQRPDVPSASGALAVSLPEAMRLSDALVASLRTRLALDPSDAEVTGRLRQLRAQLERVRDLVSAEPPDTANDFARRLAAIDARLSQMVDKAKRGADVGGLVGPLEADSDRVERDLIVGSATRATAARSVARARQLRSELEARGAAIRDLAAACVASVRPAPKLAVPDVDALGPVPVTASDVDTYLARLATVGRAMNLAHAAYSSAMDEREELRGRLEAYAIKATRVAGNRSGAWADTGHGDDDLGELFRRAQNVLSTQPADMARARALVAAHQAYLASRTAPSSRTGGTR
jgi:hypothetical protein